MLAPLVMPRTHVCLVAAGALLSAIGLVLLALDAFRAAQPWEYFARQAAGFGAGVSSFAFLRHRVTRRRIPVALPALIVPGLALVLHVDPFTLPLDRALMIALLTWAAVAVVAMVLLWRLSLRGADERLRLRDVACVLPPIVIYAIAAIDLHGGLAPPLTIAVVSTAMARSIRVRWRLALLPAVTLLLLFSIPFMTHGYRRARLAAIVVEAIQRQPATRWHSVSLAEMMVRRRDVAVRRGAGVPIWMSLPPQQTRQLALARVVAEAGSSGAALVVFLFGVIGWVGCRSAADESLCVTRLILAGTTSALVVPVAWHVIGGLVLFSASSGPLPFVSYGPAELVLTWLALGVVATARDTQWTECECV